MGLLSARSQDCHYGHQVGILLLAFSSRRTRGGP
jgi:hypothetical protein